MWFGANLWDVLFERDEFLLLERDDMSPLKPVTYMAFLAALGGLLNFSVWGLQYLFSSKESAADFSAIAKAYGVSPTVFLLFSSLAFFAVLVLAAFFATLALHMASKALGGKGGFIQSLKAVFYGLTPVFLMRAIPYVNVIGYLWSIRIQADMTAKFHDISCLRAYAAVLFSEAPPVALTVLAFYELF